MHNSSIYSDVQGGSRVTDGCEQIITPLVLNIDHFYVYRNKGNTIPVNANIHNIHLQNDIIFSQTHISSFFTKIPLYVDIHSAHKFIIDRQYDSLLQPTILSGHEAILCNH